MKRIIVLTTAIITFSLIWMQFGFCGSLRTGDEANDDGIMPAYIPSLQPITSDPQFQASQAYHNAINSGASREVAEELGRRALDNPQNQHSSGSPILQPAEEPNPVRHTNPTVGDKKPTDNPKEGDGGVLRWIPENGGGGGIHNPPIFEPSEPVLEPQAENHFRVDQKVFSGGAGQNLTPGYTPPPLVQYLIGAGYDYAFIPGEVTGGSPGTGAWVTIDHLTDILIPDDNVIDWPKGAPRLNPLEYLGISGEEFARRLERHRRAMQELYDKDIYVANEEALYGLDNRYKK